jgi:4'-phosphopantetheinyl transferase EntD
MQIDHKKEEILSPFKDQGISFSSIGHSVNDPLSFLHKDELMLVGGKESVKWKEEYARGRLAGREALRGFLGEGAVDFPILRGDSGEPIFPRGYSGSISHSAGLGVAVVSSVSLYSGLGVDIENIKKKRQVGIFRKIATNKEQAWIFQDNADIVKRGVLIFSIKESIYKAMFQAFKVKLKYMDAEVSADMKSGEASIEIFKEGLSPVRLVSGFSFFDKFVLSGVGVL